MTTFEHFRAWAAVHGGLYLAGHLRPASNKKSKADLHPQIAT
jgi:hypothetical protein